MTTPGESTPAEPPVVLAEAAAQEAQQAAQAAQTAQTQAIRDLATEIAKRTLLDFEPATIRKGTVASIADTAVPPTLGIQISGDTTEIPGIRYIDSYAPVVGETVLVIKQGTDLVALGEIAQQYTATGWTVLSLGSGFSHNGNDNGTVRYRRGWDNGSWKMQWRGGAAVTGSPTAVVSTPLASGYRPADRATAVVARDAVGTVSVKLDFNADGTITLVGGTAVPSITSTVIPAHTHAGPAHSHSGPSHTHAVFTSHQQNIGSTSGMSQSHTHSVPGGGTTGGQNQSHAHELNHTHEMDDTGASGSGQTSINGTAATGPDGGSTHGHDNNAFAPTWISFNSIEYFLD
ncbi:hypothetical protein ACH4OW_26275 [Streptomyces sp. NPDC017056]|uniref:hypothetical protein n=1 Tax=Streptomyces sp. NPDC017056 TaxID=3364973 RepID=UPI0037B2FBD8